MAHIRAWVALPTGGDELLGWVDRGDVLRPDAIRQLGGEGARAATYVDHLHPLRHSDLVREGGGQRRGVAAHEAVVVLSGGGELGHEPECYMRVGCAPQRLCPL